MSFQPIQPFTVYCSNLFNMLHPFQALQLRGQVNLSTPLLESAMPPVVCGLCGLCGQVWTRIDGQNSMRSCESMATPVTAVPLMASRPRQMTRSPGSQSRCASLMLSTFETCPENDKWTTTRLEISMEMIGNTTNSKIIQSERVYSPPLLSSLRGWIRPALSSTQFPVSNNPTEVKVGRETCGICDLTNSDQHTSTQLRPKQNLPRIPAGDRRCFQH